MTQATLKIKFHGEPHEIMNTMLPSHVNAIIFGSVDKLTTIRTLSNKYFHTRSDY